MPTQRETISSSINPFQYTKKYSISTDTEYELGDPPGSGIDTYSGFQYSIPDPLENLRVDNLLVGYKGTSPGVSTGGLFMQGPLWDGNDYAGKLGDILISDGTAVFWLDASGIGTPWQTIGLWDENLFQGVVANLNFLDGNDPNNLVRAEISGISSRFGNITVSDRWSVVSLGVSDSDVYRNSKVGIKNESPTYDLDISGSLHATQEVLFEYTLDVYNATHIYDTLTVDFDAFFNGDVFVEGIVTVLNSTQSTDPSTGALVLTDGGLGVAGNVNVGQNVGIQGTLTVEGLTTINDATSSTDSSTGALVLTNGGLGVYENLNVGQNVGIQGTLTVEQVTTINDTTQSTDTSTGALVLTNGGLGVAGNVNIGENTEILGALDVYQPSSFNSTLDIEGVTTINDSTQSTDTSTGALVLTNGGLGVAGNVNIGQDTAIEGTLEVGVGGTVITTTGIGSVGFGTNSPKKDIDFNDKDVFFNQGAIYDSNENVGFRTEEYQIPRNVLTSVNVDTDGNIIPGRFYDAANLIRLNLDFIASEAVGFITSIDYKNPKFLIVNSSGIGTDPINCKDDIKSILKSITYDITRGGNSQSVGAGLSYYNQSGVLQHITGISTGADGNQSYSVKDATISAIEKASEICRYVINNSYYPTSYQMSAINGTYADAGRLIFKNKDFIAAEAVDRTKTAYPSLVIPGGNQNCIDDIKLILDAIIYNLQFGGNDRVYDAAKFYTTNPVLSGEELESIYAYEQVKSIAIQVIRNETVTKNSGILNTFTQYKDLSVLPDPISPTCQSQASAITSFVGIVTFAIGIGDTGLPTRTDPTISIPIQQIRDLTLQVDTDRGSNTDPGGCSNVVSAITVCTGIVTTIIANGPSAAPNKTNPDGKILWAPAGADSRNLIYVTKYGNDDNDGRTEGSAKLTIGAAAEIAQPGDTIMVRSGFYIEKNPIGLRTDVSVSGQDLRLVTVCPQYDDDVFYVRRGCLIENLSFAFSRNPFYAGQNAPIVFTKGAAVAFPPPIGIGGARSGYLESGPADEGPTGRWRSPYIRNCTNFMSGSIGMKINGDHATASTIGADLKCMVCDSFTQYNENGIGVSITNNGYAQLVSIFTINSNIGIYCDTGGSCDLTNSNSSFGNYGLYAVGLGRTEFTGYVSNIPQNFGATVTRTVNGVDAGSDRVTFSNVRDLTEDQNVRRPFDGQTLFFEIDLNRYPDADTTGLTTSILKQPMVIVSEINVISGGSGFSAASPPSMLIADKDASFSQLPKGPQGIVAELSPNVNESGAITSVDVINSGRNYLPSQNLVILVDGQDSSISNTLGVELEVVTQPIYYNVDAATEPTNTGITTVTFTSFIPYELYGGENVSFKRISRILTSSHSFEYIGTGTDINTATPFKGAVPIKENEIVALDGAQIPFTSTDQKGNFDIGEGFQINQPSATIRGKDFSKAIQAEVTPLILALR